MAARQNSYRYHQLTLCPPGHHAEIDKPSRAQNLPASRGGVDPLKDRMGDATLMSS